MLQDPPRLLRIQQLRAVAAILVLHAHTMNAQFAVPRKTLQLRFYFLENFGAIGVDLFFIISGFIITLVSAGYKEKFGALHFFAKRMLRVLPLYWLLSLAFWLIGFAGIRWLKVYGSIKASFFIVPFWQRGELPIPRIYQGWSLYFELLFYSMVAFCMLLWRRHYLQLLLFALGILMLLDIYFFKTHPLWLQLAGNRVMLEFLLGIVVALIYRSKVLGNPNIRSGLLLAGCIAWALLLVNGFGDVSESIGTVSGRLSFCRSLIWGLPSSLFVLWAASADFRKPSIRMQWLVHCGDASFSIYLTHVFFLQMIYHLWISWKTCPLPGDIQVIISICFTVLAGMVVYRAVEKPLIAATNKFVASRFEKSK